MSQVIVGQGYVVIQDPEPEKYAPIATLSICDDCEEAYLDPPYYTWDEDCCTVTETDPATGITTEIPHECTFNLCPDCADQLEPDDEDDPRRPTA